VLDNYYYRPVQPIKKHGRWNSRVFYVLVFFHCFQAFDTNHQSGAGHGLALQVEMLPFGGLNVGVGTAGVAS